VGGATGAMRIAYLMREGRSAMAAPYRASPMTCGRKPAHRAAPDRRARIKIVVASSPNTIYAVIPGPGRTTTASDVGSAVR
jgi:hypothetical protein